MTRLVSLAPTELRLLARDWSVLVFTFVFPPMVMLILAGVFGTHATSGFFWQNPQHYYVTASVGVPILTLTLVGLPVTLASYRELGVLRRLEAFGVTPAQVIAAQVIVTTALVVVAVGTVLGVALATYGIPPISHPALLAAGLATGTLTLILLGTALGLAVPTARAAQAIGLLVFFPLYLLGGGGPPKGAMTGALHQLADAIPSAIPAIVDPWLGISGLRSELVVLGAWAAVAVAATWWIARRTAA